MMTRLIAILATCLLAALASAQAAPVDHKALSERVLLVFEHQFSAFRDNAAAMDGAAKAYCGAENAQTRATLIDRFRATYLAWAPLDAYQFGPIESRAAALKVNFFPDKKNFTGRALRQHLKRPLEEQGDAAVVGASSAALQGLPAIERLLYTDLPTCPTIQGIAANMASMAGTLYEDWFAPDGWADLVRRAGPDNPVYLSHREFSQQVFTALGFSILRMKEHRLGRPLGSFERAFPKRSEAWRAGLSTALIAAQFSGFQDLYTEGFAPVTPQAMLDDILPILSEIGTRLGAIGAPLSEAVEDLSMRVRIEGLQTKLGHLDLILSTELGPELKLGAGFSAGDGD